MLPQYGLTQKGSLSNTYFVLVSNLTFANPVPTAAVQALLSEFQCVFSLSLFHGLLAYCGVSACQGLGCSMVLSMYAFSAC